MEVLTFRFRVRRDELKDSSHPRHCAVELGQRKLVETAEAVFRLLQPIARYQPWGFWGQ